MPTDNRARARVTLSGVRDAYFRGDFERVLAMADALPARDAVDIVESVLLRARALLALNRAEEALGALRSLRLAERPRDEYLTAKFGSPEAYKAIAGRVVAAAGEEGLEYRPELVRRQPKTIDCHRLIHWAEATGKAAEMKQRLMELYFRDGGDLTNLDVLVQAAADCGLDPNEVRRRLASDEDVALISAQAKEASDNGISGVPTFVFAQKYAVSGAQPAEQLARAIRQVSGEINAQAAE